MDKLKIIFMGTPDFAVGILDTLYKSEFEIAAVITALQFRLRMAVCDNQHQNNAIQFFRF